jgi:hypothetical protein
MHPSLLRKKNNLENSHIQNLFMSYKLQVIKSKVKNVQSNKIYSDLSETKLIVVRVISTISRVAK